MRQLCNQRMSLRNLGGGQKKHTPTTTKETETKQKQNDLLLSILRATNEALKLEQKYCVLLTRLAAGPTVVMVGLWGW